MTDHDLIEGLKGGDRAAGEELFARFERPLIRYLRAAMPSPEAAEDAAQEVFLRFVGMAKSGAEIRSATAVVFTIARRLAIDAGRQWARRPAMASLEAADGEGREFGDTVADRREDPREAAARRERDAQVQAALLELDDETRQVIALRHIEGLSSREVAEVLGVAEGTVWSRLHRGLEALKQRLAPRTVSATAPKARTRKP